MLAFFAAGSSAAFKNDFRREICSYDTLWFKETDRQKRNLGDWMYSKGIYPKCIDKGPINLIVAGLVLEDFKGNRFEFRRINTKNFIFEFTIHIE